jgi:tetratricopeptide (TPR) repeat protein
MLRRLDLVLLLLLVSTPSWAQNQDTVFVGPHIDKLIGEGKYKEAQEFIKSGIDKSAILKTYSATYYAGAAKFYMEIGNVRDAGEALKAADAIAANTGVGNDITAREQAAFLLAQGDYGAAASMATKAARESSYSKVKNIVLAYCRSLEALARLRSGDLKRAEKLIRGALQDVPKDNDSEPLFASRVLFTGCLIESHLTRYQEAQELCRRGLEVIEKKKVDSRDVSLAHLALAESYFLSGDLARSRELIVKSMDRTAKLFQAQHQDTVSALDLLARVDLKEAKPADALAHAKAAVDMAAAVFGEGAGGTKGPTQTFLEASKAMAK